MVDLGDWGELGGIEAWILTVSITAVLLVIIVGAFLGVLDLSFTIILTSITLLLFLDIIILYRKLSLHRELIRSMIISKKMGVSTEYLLKPRKRYLIFELLGYKGVDAKRIEREFKEKLSLLSGSIGVGLSGLKVVYYDARNGLGIIRFYHLYKKLVLLSLSLIRRIDGNDVVVIPIKTTGTLRKAREILKKRVD